MYESHYNLSEKPFSLLPDPQFLYHSVEHDASLLELGQALASLDNFIVVSGDIGAGKTTIVRHLLDGLDDQVDIGLVSNCSGGFAELLEWIAYALGIEHKDASKEVLFNLIAEHIIQRFTQGRRTLLIFDEAQNLAIDAIEELRSLSNLNTEGAQLLQVLLVGQNELREKIDHPALEGFRTQLGVRINLEPLKEHETVAYIRHRLTVAGGNPDLIEANAAREIHRCSAGVPRLINTLCDSSMVFGYAAGLQHIDRELVLDVIRTRLEGGLLPLADVPIEGTPEIVAPADEPSAPSPVTAELVAAQEMQADQEPETEPVPAPEIHPEPGTVTATPALTPVAAGEEITVLSNRSWLLPGVAVSIAMVVSVFVLVGGPEKDAPALQAEAPAIDARVYPLQRSDADAARDGPFLLTGPL